METEVEGPLPPDMPYEGRTYFTYIMGSLSGTLYVGVTSSLRKRVFEHRFHRIEGFTDNYDVERLLYWESFEEVQKAIRRSRTRARVRAEVGVLRLRSRIRLREFVRSAQDDKG